MGCAVGQSEKRGILVSTFQSKKNAVFEKQHGKLVYV